MSTGANVFTYGSLMYEAVWTRVVRGQYASARARLPGFRRLAIRDETYPAVVADAGAEVLGRLWFDISPDDIERLDRFEGSEYRRQAVPVTLLAARNGAPGDRVESRAGAQPVANPDRLSAHCYLWLDPTRLLAQAWDEASFEREHLADFALRHAAQAARSGDPAGGSS